MYLKGKVPVQVQQKSISKLSFVYSNIFVIIKCLYNWYQYRDSKIHRSSFQNTFKSYKINNQKLLMLINLCCWLGNKVIDICSVSLYLVIIVLVVTPPSPAHPIHYRHSSIRPGFRASWTYIRTRSRTRIQGVHGGRSARRLRLATLWGGFCWPDLPSSCARWRNRPLLLQRCLPSQNRLQKYSVLDTRCGLCKHCTHGDAST